MAVGLNFLLMLSLSVVSADQVLEKLSTCSCSLPNNTVIDLKSLALTNGQPKFRDTRSQEPGSTWVYSYNPCYAFTQSSPAEEGTLCKNVAVCQHSPEGSGSTQPWYYSLGQQESVKFELKSSPAIRSILNRMTLYDHDVISQFKVDTENHVTLTYLDNESPPQRSSLVVLTCSDKSDFVTVGEMPATKPIEFVFLLTDPAACPVAYTGSGGLSVGSVLCILLLVTVILYIVGGVLFMKYVKKEGDIKNLMPNKPFWVALPGYVKDGCKYSYAVVTRKPVDNYQQI